MHKFLHTIFYQRYSIVPLVTFRITFGILLLYSTLRFAYNGWIEKLYINPKFYFPFIEGVSINSGLLIYSLYVIMTLSALFIVLGLFFRISSSLFFIIFSYFELLDKTYYLNHHYLVALLTFCLTITSGHKYFSIDTLIWPKMKKNTCNAWEINILKIQLSMVYFFAGLAKVNGDWLFSAQPLATWLPGRYSLPIIGQWMHLKWIAFVFSWMGCLYDLFIWVFLWFKKTRPFAYFAVLIFHLLTYILFPRIGLFPFIMMTSTLLFFSANWHEKLLDMMRKIFQSSKNLSSLGYKNAKNLNGNYDYKRQLVITPLLCIYLLVQFYLPLRHLFYSGELFWNERGYRFSWRVMLIEKSGFTRIVIEDPKTATRSEIDQDLYLTPFQKKEMSTQPDMILQFVHFIGNEFKKKEGYAPKIYVTSRVSLNGRRSQPFINDQINAYALKNPFENEEWVLLMTR